MKKQIIALLISLSFATTAQAADSFTSQREVNKKREDMEAARIQRESDTAEYTKKTYEELEKSNKLNAEISAKLDKLIELSTTNNELMDALLKRTE